MNKHETVDYFAILQRVVEDIQLEQDDISLPALSRLQKIIGELEEYHTDLATQNQHLKQSNKQLAAQIAESKAIQQELVEQELKYQIVIENFPNGIVGLFDHDLRYTLIGGKGLEATGLSKEDFVGKRLRDTMPPDIYQRDEPALKAALQGKTIVSTVLFGDRTFRVLTSPTYNRLYRK